MSWKLRHHSVVHATIPLRRKTHIIRQLKRKDLDNLKQDTSSFFPPEGTKGCRNEIWNSDNKSLSVQILIQDQIYSEKPWKAIVGHGNTELRSVLLHWDLNAGQDSISCVGFWSELLFTNRSKPMEKKTLPDSFAVSLHFLLAICLSSLTKNDLQETCTCNLADTQTSSLPSWYPI